MVLRNTATNKVIRFRISPVMTTSIPLHDRALHIYIVYPAGRENAIHLFAAFF